MHADLSISKQVPISAEWNYLIKAIIEFYGVPFPLDELTKLAFKPFSGRCPTTLNKNIIWHQSK